MLSNIPMGQYYPVDSPVHRLDPRIKLILTVAFIVAVFMAGSFIGYAIILAFIFFTARLARIPFSMLLRGLKPLRVIIILTFIVMDMNGSFPDDRNGITYLSETEEIIEFFHRMIPLIRLRAGKLQLPADHLRKAGLFQH